MRFALVAAGLLASSCALKTEIPTPVGAGDDGRFALVLSSELAACGPLHEVMPALGRIPALAHYTASNVSSPATLLEIDPAALRPALHDDASVELYHAKIALDPDAIDTIAMPPPRRAWSLHDGSVFEIDPGSIAAITRELFIVRPNACTARIDARCTAKDTLQDRCAALDTTDILLPDTRDDARTLTFALALDDGSAIAGARPSGVDGPRFFHVTPSSTSVDLLPIDPVTPYLASYLALDGSAWLFGPNGHFASGRFEVGFRPVQTSRSTAYGYAWIVGPTHTLPSGARANIFALSENGLFEEFDGDVWHTLTASSADVGTIDRADMTWIGDREAAAVVGQHLHGVLRARNGAAMIEPLPTIGIDFSVSAIAFVPGLGLIAGTLQGSLFVDDGNGWAPLAGTNDQIAVQGIAPFEDGFVFGRSPINGVPGFITQFVKDLGFCDSVRAAPSDIERIIPMRDGFLIVSKDAPTNVWLTFARRKTSSAACPGPH